ncbi:MAG TPA: amidohydrolase family protein [Allosphingosinicella sp.]|nr:amidohydrolase family protein [Allosphingosinicella sp.]
MLRLLLVALLGALGACATHRVTAVPEGGLLIENVTVVDVAAGGSRPGLSILVLDGRIAEVAPRIRLPRGARRIDGRGRYAIPGLWDMHAHHQVAGESSLPLFLAHGVTGTRDMGGDAAFIFPLRERIRSGALAGPEIVAAGPILDAAPAEWPLRRRVADAAQARAAVRDLAAAGADFIKVHDQTPREAYFAIAEETRRLGIPFAGHVPATVTAEEAVSSGQASIEHLSNFQLFLQCSGGEAYDRERCMPFFRRLAAGRIWQTPTLVFMRSLPGIFEGEAIPHSEYASAELERFGRANQEASRVPPEAVAWFRVQGEAALVAVRDMKAAGAPFLAGCDAMVPGFCLHDELEWLTRAGFSPLEALQTATINPARFLGREATDGTIAPGRLANIVLLDANPLTAIANTRRIHAVIVRGRLLDRAELDAMLARARRPIG